MFEKDGRRNLADMGRYLSKGTKSDPLTSTRKQLQGRVSGTSKVQESPKMKLGACALVNFAWICAMAYSAPSWADPVKSTRQSLASDTPSLWAHENLYVWDIVDSLHRSPEERAEMLEHLGFKRYAYFSGSQKTTQRYRHEFEDVHGDPETQVEALQRHLIDVVAWYLWDGADDPHVKATFELFKRHNLHPQVWISQDYGWVSASGIGTLHVPVGISVTKTSEQWERLSAAQWGDIFELLFKLNEEELPSTVQAQGQRIMQEASRIRSLAELAARYGCVVALYNHEGRWFGNEKNELAIVTYLKEHGIANVGLVYNFSHAVNRVNRERDYDDTKHFPELWRSIEPHVVAVNITAVGGKGADLGQGDSELMMMRTIQESGWKGPIGVEVHHPGDAAVILRSDLTGLDRLAAELAQPDHANPR